MPKLTLYLYNFVKTFFLAKAILLKIQKNDGKNEVFYISVILLF